MRQNFGKKNEIFENKIFVDKNDLICGIGCLASLMNARTLCMNCIMCVRIVSRGGVYALEILHCI